MNTATLATVIQLETLRFCRRFINHVTTQGTSYVECF